MYLHGTFKKQDFEEKASPRLPAPVQTHTTWAQKGEVKTQLGSCHSSSPSWRQSDNKDDKHLLDLVAGCPNPQRLRADLRQKSPKEPEQFKVAQDKRDFNKDCWKLFRSSYVHTSSPHLPQQPAPSSTAPAPLSSLVPKRVRITKLLKFSCISYTTYKMGLLYTISSTAVLGSHSYWPQALRSFYLSKKKKKTYPYVKHIFTSLSLNPSTTALKNSTQGNKDNTNLSYRWQNRFGMKSWTTSFMYRRLWTPILLNQTQYQG